MSKRIEMGSKIGDGIRFGSLPEVDRQFVVNALKKGASRRQVMGWMMAMGATVAAAGSIVTAAGDAIAATPKRGGQIRFAWDYHGPDDTLDPTKVRSTIDYIRARCIFNNLCRIQEDLTAAPELAESFEPNADATEWVFKLRRDVEFHDGSPFTADDVIYTMNQHIGPDTTSTGASLMEDVDEWVKDDAYTVRAKLKAPNGELPVILSTFYFKIIKNGTTDFSAPVGTGPFMASEFRPGVRTVHRRNDNYWGPDGPYVDEIEIFGITDTVARVNALINGDINIMGNLDPKTIPQVEGADGVEVYSVNSGAYMTLISRYDNSPAGTANHLDFITGLKHLQRRDRVLQVVQKGIGDIGNDQPIGPAYGASWCTEANDPPIFGYDPDKAKFHLNRAGITAAEIKVAEVGPGLTDICLLLQRECAKVGFNLQVKKVPNDGYWGAIWNKDPFHVASWNMRPTANIMTQLAYAPGARWNESEWNSERLGSLLAQSKAATDPAKRYELNCEMQRLIAMEAGTMIATHRAYIDGIASNVKGLTRVPLMAVGGGEWPETVWLDS